MNTGKRLDGMPCFAIYSANLAIQRTYKPLLDKVGITYPQFLLLNVLWEMDCRTVGQLSARMGIESSMLTPLLKRLQAGGFVERSRNPDDERQVLIRLTERSMALKEWGSCLGPEVFGGTTIDVDRIYKIRDEVKELRDALIAKLALKGQTGTLASSDA